MSTEAVNDTPTRALGVALAVAFVCALAVSLAAVTLKPLYLANQEQARVGRLLVILDALAAQGRNYTLDDIETRAVRLDDGVYDDSINLDEFDPIKAALETATSVDLESQEDIAGIRRRGLHAVIYLVRNSANQPDVVILPVYGIGYQSTMRGYLALDGNANNIVALTFYEQGETPGLGGRIEEPGWQALWQGKQAYADDGAVAISVGGSDHGDSPHQVDGISGATHTTRGVQALVRFWLGERGFGPYLNRVREGLG